MKYPGSLHNHTQMSNFRLRDCIIKEEDLINRAIELEHSVLAITDHETIASAVRIEKIYKKIKEKNIPLKIILGNEIYLCRNNLNNENYNSEIDKYYHFILLAKDRIGFQQICELSTRAWKRSYVSRNMRWVPTYYKDIQEIIGKNPGHVIGTTACLGGAIPTQILKYKKTESKELWEDILNWCVSMTKIFGQENFFLELQPSASEEQTYVNEKLIEINDILNIDYIITCDSHYLTKEDRAIHKAYLNAQNGDREVDSFYATTYLMDTEDLINHLSLTSKQIEMGFNNIIKIQNMCEDYSILKTLKIPFLKPKKYNIQIDNWFLEKIPYLQTFLNSNYESDRLLVYAIIEGIKKHKDLQNQKSYNELNNNLEATWISSKVNKTRWSAYYLNLQKIIELCWEAGSIVGPGRGSGVGFLLLYCLDITQINPLRENTRCFAWRFLNPERVSVLDIDFDIEGRKRTAVFSKFKDYYGEDRVSNVTTFRTEKPKAAILTAARGLNIDNDTAQYLAGLIPSDRGQLRTLKEVFYGDEEKGFKPVPSFVKEMTNNYPKLWEVAQKIEGLICGTGIHAGGVIFTDEPFTNSTALMRAPDGTICTQFDLHDAEDVSLIKYDALSVEAMDKIHICLDLLCEYGFIEKKPTLKETYEQVLGIYNIERNDKNMWKMVWDHKILSLFQMEKESGIKGISVLKPTSVDDLAILNSAIRLMAQEKGGEMPVDKLARFKNDPQEWKNEIKKYGLTEKEYNILYPILSMSYGLCIAQEQFMELVQLPELGGFSLTWADKLRKSIAKKNPEEYDILTKEFYRITEEKGVNQNFAHYVWDVLISMSKGYGFNQSHTLAYSLIGLQEMNLAFRFPIIFWNCACLISDSGSSEENNNTDKNKTTDYKKIAKAIGIMQSNNVKISLVDINTSDYTFKPNVDNNEILYGMRALNNIGDEVVEKIKKNRPFTGIKDFMNRCPLKKTQMISLIKAGAFDKIDRNWAIQINKEPRLAIMAYYISIISEPKTKLTLQNLSGLINKKLFPDSLKYEQKTFAFNKYLKNNKINNYYSLSVYDLEFYENFYNNEGLENIEGIFCIKQKIWDKIYQKIMDNVRKWLQENQKYLLNQYNNLLFKENWAKYAKDNISAWEMESMCFYYHAHELSNIDFKKYGIVDFFNLPYQPKVINFFRKKFPIYSLSKIAGTVIARDNNKSTISLLTTTGVVDVKFTKEYYAMFNKQISEVQPNGNKKVIEKSWFTKGTKLLITGYRREDTFVSKTYKNTPTHQLYKIEKIKGIEIFLTHERQK